MKVGIVVNFKDKGGKDDKRKIYYVNPNATEEELLRFVKSLYGLTENQVQSIEKVSDRELDDDDFVLPSEIADILSGNFTPVDDDSPISDADLILIIGGDFSPADDDSPLTDKDFVFD